MANSLGLVSRGRRLVLGTNIKWSFGTCLRVVTLRLAGNTGLSLFYMTRMWAGLSSFTPVIVEICRLLGLMMS